MNISQNKKKETIDSTVKGQGIQKMVYGIGEEEITKSIFNMSDFS